MIKLITFFQMLVVSFLFSGVLATAAPVPVDLTTGSWTITATDQAGTSWDGSSLFVETQTVSGDNWLLTGFFNWTADSGAFGRENFTGTFFSDRSIELNGFEIVQPASGIGYTDYFATLGLSNNVLENGTWATGNPFDPFDDWSAARNLAAVPLPPTIWMFLIGLVGFAGFIKRRT